MNCRTVYPDKRVPFALWLYYVKQSAICIRLKIEMDKVFEQACKIVDQCLFKNMLKENIQRLKRHRYHSNRTRCIMQLELQFRGYSYYEVRDLPRVKMLDLLYRNNLYPQDMRQYEITLIDKATGLEKHSYKEDFFTRSLAIDNARAVVRQKGWTNVRIHVTVSNREKI